MRRRDYWRVTSFILSHRLLKQTQIKCSKNKHTLFAGNSFPILLPNSPHLCSFMSLYSWERRNVAGWIQACVSYMSTTAQHACSMLTKCQTMTDSQPTTKTHWLTSYSQSVHLPISASISQSDKMSSGLDEGCILINAALNKTIWYCQMICALSAEVKMLNSRPFFLCNV